MPTRTVLTDINDVPVGYASGNPLYVSPTGTTGTQDVNLKQVNGVATTGALALDASVTAMSAKLPATLGAKTGALSVSVVPNTDTNFPVVGAETAGSAVTGAGLRMMGSDATNARDLLTDTSGRQIITGPAAQAAATAGNPVVIAGLNSTTVQALNVDNEGTPKIQGNRASGAAAAGSPVPCGGADSAGVTRRILTDTTGGTIQGGLSFTNITTATTTTIKSGSGVFKVINVNTPVASATITIYDSLTASGTKIATLTLPSVITGIDPFTMTFDCAFATGLTIVTSGATDVTATWR